MDIAFVKLSPRWQDVFEGRTQAWKVSTGLSDPRFAIKDGGEGFENEMAGACSQASQQLDRFVSPELVNKLFANKKLLGEAQGRM